MSKLKHYTNTIRNLERMVVELSPYMTEYEIDRCVGFCHTVGTSQFDTNPSVEDSKGQIKLILGEQRYWEVIKQWNDKNQILLKENGARKLRRKSDNTLWDGLDPEDDPNDYVEVYI